MNIETLGPIKDNFVWQSYKVTTDIEEYDIWLHLTVMGSTRVILLDPVFSGQLLKNWCAGNSPAHITKLLNVMLEMLETDQLEKIPFCSNPKPFFNDVDFLMAIAPFRKFYLDPFI